MIKIEQVYTKCERCGKDIYSGNAVVTLNLNIEQLDITPKYPKGITTVVSSDELLTLCGSCGNKFGEELTDSLLPSEYTIDKSQLN